MIDDPDHLIDQIYDAALDPALWQPIMDRLADLVGGGPSMFIRKNFATGVGEGLYSRVDAAAFADYWGEFARRNPLAAAVAELPAGSFLIDWQVMEKADLIRSDYYNGFLRRLGIHGVLGLKLWQDGDEAAILNLTRAPSQPEFQPADAARLAPFMPHLRRATALARRLPVSLRHAAIFNRLVDHWQEALLLLDGTGLVLYANPAGKRILDRRDGLLVRHGRLGAADAVTAQRLDAAIRAAIPPTDGAGAGRPGSIFVPRVEARHPYNVLLMPAPGLAGSWPRASARVILTVTDLDAASRVDPALLAEAFGLSRAQAAVAARLLDGRDVGDIATALGLSPHTVRRHVADIMERTGTTRQVELVLLLSRVPRGMDGKPAGSLLN